MPSDVLVIEARAARGPLQNAGDRSGIESLFGDMPMTIDGAEYGALAFRDSCLIEPGTQGPHRAGVFLGPEWNSRLMAGVLLVGLASPPGDHDSRLGPGQIADVEIRQFAAPAAHRESTKNQGAVADAKHAGRTVGNDAAYVRNQKRVLRAGRDAKHPARAFEDLADQVGSRGRFKPGGPVSFRDRCQSLRDR